MASFHLSVKTVSRSAGRSATAAAAYRSGDVIECQREGRTHDYTAKQGIEETFIITPADVDKWKQDREGLWNAAEAAENRKNSVVAREWEVALPSELNKQQRCELVGAFAQQIVDRYGVVADVAVHAPHRDGDQRNYHAHILTTTREVSADGFGAKTRILDSAKTGSAEIESMREIWAHLQNRELERVGAADRVDHRSLDAQREDALARGDQSLAEELDRPAEIKLGPAANAMERRAMQEAAREGRPYEPVTERGAFVHTLRQAKDYVLSVREQLYELAALAKQSYSSSRDEGRSIVRSGLAAIRETAAAIQREEGPSALSGREALRQMAQEIRDQEYQEQKDELDKAIQRIIDQKERGERER